MFPAEVYARFAALTREEVADYVKPLSIKWAAAVIFHHPNVSAADKESTLALYKALHSMVQEWYGAAFEGYVLNWGKLRVITASAFEETTGQDHYVQNDHKIVLAAHRFLKSKNAAYRLPAKWAPYLDSASSINSLVMSTEKFDANITMESWKLDSSFIKTAGRNSRNRRGSTPVTPIAQNLPQGGIGSSSGAVGSEAEAEAKRQEEERQRKAEEEERERKIAEDREREAKAAEDRERERKAAEDREREAKRQEDEANQNGDNENEDSDNSEHDEEEEEESSDSSDSGDDDGNDGNGRVQRDTGKTIAITPEMEELLKKMIQGKATEEDYATVLAVAGINVHEPELPDIDHVGYIELMKQLLETPSPRITSDMFSEIMTFYERHRSMVTTGGPNCAEVKEIKEFLSDLSIELADNSLRKSWFLPRKNIRSVLPCGIKPNGQLGDAASRLVERNLGLSAANVNRLMSNNPDIADRLKGPQNVLKFSSWILATSAGFMPQMVEKYKRSFTRESPVNVDSRTDFDESSLPVVEYSAEQRSFIEAEYIEKFSVMDLGLKLVRYNWDVDGVARLIELNNWDLTAQRDHYFASILLAIIHFGFLPAANPPTNLPNLAGTNTVKPAILPTAMRLAKLVSIASIHAYCQGLEDNGIKWFDSFEKTFGSFISEARLAKVFKAMFNAGTIGRVMELTTIRSILPENNVLKYRLNRLSSPTLIKQAISIMNFDQVLEYFDPEQLLKYREYDQAGILAQIASGPLSPFCKGPIDVLKYKNIPLDATLSQLAPIPEAPYHEPTIRKAMIILDEAEAKYGTWYQGRRAMRTMTAEDIKFKALVHKISQLLARSATIEELTEGDLGIGSRENDDDAKQKIKDVVSGWV